MTDIEKEIKEYARRMKRKPRRLGADIPPGYVTVPEWARLHKMTVNKVYTAMHHCRLEYIKVNGKLMVHRDAKIITTKERRHGN